ncbi:ankyrin repeat-containing domain protein, partial [Triangularia setosa]
IAIENDREVTVKLLLKKGALLNVQDLHGKTPLSFAIERKLYYLVRILFEAGVDPNIRQEGESTLAYMIKAGDERVVGLLVRSGAYLESRNIRQQTPLCLAVKSSSMTIVQFLIVTRQPPVAWITANDTVNCEL